MCQAQLEAVKDAEPSPMRMTCSVSADRLVRTCASSTSAASSISTTCALWEEDSNGMTSSARHSVEFAAGQQLWCRRWCLRG